MNVPTLLRFSLLVAPLLLAANGISKSTPNSGQNSAEDLLRPARIRNVTMSLDGKHAAGLAPISGMDGDIGLVIIDLDTMKIKRSFKWRAGYDIYRYNWLNNDYISFNVTKWNAFAAGIYRINIHKPKIEPLIKDDAAAEIIYPNPSHPTDAWIWIRDARRANPALAKLDKTGSATTMEQGQRRIQDTEHNHLLSERISQPAGDVYWWYVDWDHEPRIVSRFHQEKLEYLHRSNAKEDWQPLPLDPEVWEIELFASDNQKLYVSGYNGHETKGLYLYDIAANSLSESIFRDEYYDFSETAMYMTFQDRLFGIQYDKDVPSMVWLAPEIVEIQKTIDSALPGKVNIIYNWSDDFTRHLIYSYSDTNPPEYVLLDLKNRSLTEISKSAPWLNYDKLAKTEVFHFRTEDGLRLEGYLTRPIVGEAPYPTVALVHGGPWARDFGTYHDEVQFLASRGYAVLKINFRGSTGYGKRISKDPEFQFRKMHEDITAGVKMAVKAGIADPDRLAIMGASFGGYAAMCGAAFEPELYKCAITNMGVFDWEELIKDRKRQRHRYSYHKLVQELGDPKAGLSERFEEISPIYHVDKVKIPIFVIHGKKDKNVSIRQSKDLVSALRKAEVEHEVLFVGGEGHNVFELKRKKETYERIAAFLDEHLE